MTVTHLKPARRGRRAIAITAIALGGLWAVAGPASLAFAQSPKPNHHFLDWRPSVFNTRSSQGVVVEGVGSGRCAYSFSSIEKATLRYVRAKKPVWTEFSPQSHCASVKSYESMIHSLIHYVESKAPSDAKTYWAGVMLDEEPNFGFSAASVISLNKYANAQTGKLPGITFVSTEDATWKGAWSQRQYDNIVHGTVAAPQVYNSYMVGIANNSHVSENLVTVNPAMPHPFNSASYVLGRVKGSPYLGAFGTRTTTNWYNVWQSQ
jgi:hypothetical protein